MDLLLLADFSEHSIYAYLDKGDCYVHLLILKYLVYLCYRLLERMYGLMHITVAKIAGESGTIMYREL